MMWLSFGSPSLASWRDSVIAETPSRKYKPAEVADFVRAARGPEVEDTARTLDEFVSNPGKYDPLATVPDYELHCLHGCARVYSKA